MNAKEFRQKLASPMLWGNLLAMALVVAALFFGLMWWLSVYTHHNKTVEVPHLHGMDYSTAVERLQAEGLQLVANDSAYNKKLPAGCVLAQLPAKGAMVKEGRTIYVTINSLTLSRLEIPDLIDNSSYREAQAKLQAMGFRLSEPRLIEGERDWVYGIQCNGRNVTAGDMVARESTLTLVIGNGLVADEELDTGSAAMSSFMHSGDDETDDIDDFLEVTEED